jgi:rod shape-determining protein MreB
VRRKVENKTEKQLSMTTSVICCPSEVTKIERDVMIELAKNMGSPDVFIEEEIKAGALGSGVDIFESKGLMIVDIGGGTTDVGVLSFGDIVLSRTIRMAGNFMDDQIAKYIKTTRGIEIGELTAEKCKIDLATLKTDNNTIENRYAGRDIVKGIPRWINVNTKEVREVLEPIFTEIVKLISALLKDTPPELSADIYDRGIILTGGGSLIKGVAEFISERIHIPVRVVENPLTCVAEGTRFLLKNRGDYLVNPLQL